MTSIIFPCAVAALLIVTMVLPTIRVWRRYRTWPVVFQREADPFQKLMGATMSTLLASVLLWSVLHALAGPKALGVYAAPETLSSIGWALFVAGTVIVIVAQLHMGASWRIGIDDRPTELIRRGLFAWVRNPIFSGLLLALLGMVLIAPAPWSIMGFAGISTLIAFQVRLEEKHLGKLHGEPYIRYAARVGRFVPGIGRLKPAAHPS